MSFYGSDMDKEIWKAIEGFEGKYAVSNLGRVKSLIGWNGHEYIKRDKILKSSISNEHYACVTLHTDKKQVRREVHRLVAQAFIPNPNNLPMVMHIDENKYSNVASNLKWGTQEENMNFPNFKLKQSQIAKRRVGERNPFYGKHHTDETRRKLSLTHMGKNSINARKVKGTNKNNDEVIFDSIADAGRALGILPQNISACCRGIGKTAGGYKWRYYE